MTPQSFLAQVTSLRFQRFSTPLVFWSPCFFACPLPLSTSVGKFRGTFSSDFTPFFFFCSEAFAVSPSFLDLICDHFFSWSFYGLYLLLFLSAALFLFVFEETA